MALFKNKFVGCLNARAFTICERCARLWTVLSTCASLRLAPGCHFSFLFVPSVVVFTTYSVCVWEMCESVTLAHKIYVPSKNKCFTKCVLFRMRACVVWPFVTTCLTGFTCVCKLLTLSDGHPSNVWIHAGEMSSTRTSAVYQNSQSCVVLKCCHGHVFYLRDFTIRCVRYIFSVKHLSF
jgi:hypothetical protein